MIGTLRKSLNKLELAKMDRKLAYFWQPKNGEPNIGDHLALEIVRKVLDTKDFVVGDKKSNKNKLLSIGSVLHFAKNSDTVWGTGRNGKIADDIHKFTNLDVRAVRGPLTRDFLLARDIHCPEVYGDPGLLCPYFYPEKLLCPEGPDKEFIIVPQLNDDMSFYKGFEQYLCSPRQYPAAFIKQLLSAKKVVASSLHGLIIAESYGRQATFLDSNSGEAPFKYEDYYLGTGRDSFKSCHSIEDALTATTSPIVDLDQQLIKMVSAFPFELWQ
jgi:pyruvyltransferase